MTATNLALQPRTVDAKQVATATVDQRGAHDRIPQLAPHFDTMPQQYEAAKLGMWLFLATEVLLFGGLFCAYAVFRGNHPEVFAWVGERGFLDVKWGAANTVVLIVSSVFMATAVTYVQRNRRWPVIIALAATFLCGVIFMAVKSVEYEHKFHENLVWGTKFYELPPGFDLATGSGAAGALAAGDLAQGTRIWNTTCRSCHGVAGEGVAGQGRDIRSSEFIQSRDDLELVAYIKLGRTIRDPLNTTGMAMPAKGGNPLLTDQDLVDVIAYVRNFQAPLPQFTTDNAVKDDTAAQERVTAIDVAADDVVRPSTPAAIETASEPVQEEFWIPASSIPLARSAPAGMNLAVLAAHEGTPQSPRFSAAGRVHQSVDPDRPANAHLFFAFYFVMTGLHGLHVLVGLGVIAWLMVRSIWGHFGRTYFAPVDLGGLYWHVVDLIWIFLFPLFYLLR